MAIRFRGAGGIELAADLEGTWDGPLVLLLHGGGQTRHSWGGAMHALATQGYLAISLDARGHGESDWSPDGEYSVDHYVDDLRGVVDQLGNRPVAFVGASLGGMTGLVAVGEHPDEIACTALVLVDITPRMRNDGRDRIGAFMRAKPEGFASIEEAADAVSAYLPHRPRPKDVSGLRKNLRLGEDGRYHWHWDPAMMSMRDSEEAQRADRMEEAAAVAARVAPMLLVRGTESELVDEEGVKSLLAVAPGAEYVDVPSARHMVAGDQNDIFSTAVLDFLARSVPPTAPPAPRR